MTKRRLNPQTYSRASEKVLIHPHQAVIEGEIQKLGFELNEIKRGDGQTGVSYSLYFTSGLRAFFTLYKDNQNTCFLFFEVILGIVPKEHEAAISLEMMKENYENFFPLWCAFTVRDTGTYAALILRSYADGLTPEHVALRVKTIIELGIRLHEKYINEFGLEACTELIKTERKLAS